MICAIFVTCVIQDWWYESHSTDGSYLSLTRKNSTEILPQSACSSHGIKQEKNLKCIVTCVAMNFRCRTFIFMNTIEILCKICM